MNTHLLIAIREAKERLVPEIEKRKSDNPCREAIMKWIRIISAVKEIPVMPLKSNIFFLDSVLEPNSKARFVVDEFISAGMEKKKFFIKNNRIKKIESLSRIIFYFPQVLPDVFRILFRFNFTLDLIDLHVIVGHFAYIKFLKINKKIIPIIISDITPNSHMLWSAAICLGREVLWWQDDYDHHLHYQAVSKENYLPYPCTMAAVLNQLGFESVLENNAEAKVYLRNETKVNSLKNIPKLPKVGLALNAFFEANIEEIELIKFIKKKLGIDFLMVRLHPNSKLSLSSFPLDLVQIASRDESIFDFVSSVDLAVVGNSAVQIKLLCEGLPLIHMSGLDPHGYDYYGYCKNGICFGSKELIDLDLDDIKRFYSNSLIGEKLTSYVNVKNKELCQPLSVLTEIHKN